MNAQAIERPRLYGSKRAAELLGISWQALLKAEAEGRIPPPQREDGGDDRIFTVERIEELRAYFGRR